MKQTGKVTLVTSDPPGFKLHVAEPEPDGSDSTYTPVTPEQLAVATAAYVKDADCEVEGTPPSCTKVTAK